jgi:hypothetical protein
MNQSPSSEITADGVVEPGVQRRQRARRQGVPVGLAGVQRERVDAGQRHGRLVPGQRP